MEVAEVTVFEVLKLAVSAITPLVVATVGLWIQRTIKLLESKQWRNQALIEWRIREYDHLAPLLNDIYCYCVYVGLWKELTPRDVIDRKRQTDKRFFTARPLFSDNLLRIYKEFMAMCFQEEVGKGKDALIKANVEMHREAQGDKWEEAWSLLFVSPECRTRRADVRQSYDKLMQSISAEIGL